MKRSNLKYLVPNGITFISLSLGVGAIMAAFFEIMALSGAMIFISYWLDSIDGYSARKLGAQSEFGLNLDSLSDMVSLGVAPAILVFQHLRLEGANLYWVIPMVIIYTIGGAFRLARFNTLPAKTTSNKESVGLTITQSGCTVALAMLAEYVPDSGLLPETFNIFPNGFLPTLAYLPLLALLSWLMMSRIRFLPSQWFFTSRKFGRYLLMFLLILVFLFQPFATWFTIYLVYILISTGRALIYKLRPGLQT